jgi:2'-5' RNA ligase
MKGTGFSLWIVPEGEVRRRLATLIRVLARRFGGPVFEPHVTLLAGVPGPAREALSRAREAVGAQGPFEVRFLGAEAGDSYFRCLYLRVQPSPELAALHERACEAFGRRNEAPFFPHLSLLYAPPPAPPVVDEIRASLPAGFGARRVDVYSTEGEAARWHRLGRMRLG